MEKEYNSSFTEIPVISEESTLSQPINGVVSGVKLMEMKTESLPCLWGNIFPKVAVCAFAGSSDTGKSSFLRQLAVSVSAGKPKFLGLELNTERNKAIYVSTEDDESAVSYLLNMANKKNGYSIDDYQGLTFIFETENLIKKLDECLSVQGADLVVIDAFTDLYGKSMNDTNQVRTFINDYHQLAVKHKCLFIFLHHTGKRTEDLEPSKHNLLGSQGFEAKMRLVIELRNDHISASKKHLCIVKGNYLPQEYKTESYVMNFDDSLQFSMTGDRVLFEELKTDNKREIKEIVRNMHEDGKSQTQIAKELNISQSTVSRYLK